MRRAGDFYKKDAQIADQKYTEKIAESTQKEAQREAEKLLEQRMLGDKPEDISTVKKEKPKKIEKEEEEDEEIDAEDKLF